MTRVLRFHLFTVAGLLIAATCAFAQPASAPAAWAPIEVPAGFEVVPVAGAPLVRFPMLGGFDERGRLFIAENAGVNLDDKALNEQLPSRITMLEDTDRDGVFDRSSVFADKLAFPQGALWHDGALFVTSAPSLWRIEDRDGDGRAEVRTEIATGFKSTGNAADVHGPFLHPNGRLYWCHGRKGHEVYQNNGGALVSKGLGARIWSCRPDGTDIQVHAGGGMDNPVEVAFNQEGEMFGTANLFHGTPRSDAILHWVHGGVYPRFDQEPVIAEFKRTGDLLPPVTLIGHVAPAGIALPPGDAFGADYKNNLFYAEFNTRRIMRVPLERNGSTYRGHAEPFATSGDAGVHFTDVIPDADGSLLIVNTGAWFRRGCPTSIVARADITGGIYRIRRINRRAPHDPRGGEIKWDVISPEALVTHLGDERPAVRDRAVAELARRGESVVSSLVAALNAPHFLTRSNVVWTLTRIASPAAQAAARIALRDRDARVREVACQSAFITRDVEATELLVTRLDDETPSVQREAARALGQLRNPKAIAALGNAAGVRRDPILTHALVFALIEIDAPAETRALLGHSAPLARRAALIALDRSTSAKLDAKSVFSALRDSNSELRSAALDIAVRHPEWATSAADFFAKANLDTNEPAARNITVRLLSAFLPSTEVRSWVRGSSETKGTHAALDPLVLLEAMANAPEAWDETWRELLIASLRSTEPRRAQAALRAIAAHRKRDFSSTLQEIGGDTTRPTSFRVAALQLAAGGNATMDAASFEMLLQPLRHGGTADARLQAATVLSGAKLTREQLLALTEVLPAAGPVELQQLLNAFQRGPADAPVAAKLQSQLAAAPARWGLLPASLHATFQRYPAPAHETAEALISEIANQNVAKDSRVAELESLTATGDPARGRTLFQTGAGACVTCHRVGENGGKLGPDLSHIGQIRSIRDLVEAIAFPTATIARGYEAFQITTKDGNAIVGTVPREAGDTLFVHSADGRETPLPRSSIAKQEPLAMSLMPAGLDHTLEPKAFADLVAFLKSLQ